MRDPQEYDYTDTYYDVLDDIDNFEGFNDFVTSSKRLDWKRAAKSFAWEGSVFTQWVEEICWKRIDPDDVMDALPEGMSLPMQMAYQADNYGNMGTEDEAKRVLELIELWKAEELI